MQWFIFAAKLSKWKQCISLHDCIGALPCRYYVHPEHQLKRNERRHGTLEGWTELEHSVISAWKLLLMLCCVVVYPFKAL